MNKGLVIVESPAKARTIGKILGSSFAVRSSMGHIRDLPEKTFGVNIEKNFLPTYQVTKGRKKILQDLNEAIKSVKHVYLATDPDREGEAIAWHLHEILKNKAKSVDFRRVTSTGHRFDALGGLGKFYQLFGQNYESVLNELNEGLVA